jgi:hypothetical protein
MSSEVAAAREHVFD